MGRISCIGFLGVLSAYKIMVRYFTKDFTEEQKADIMRRFKEVEKYTVIPTYYPSGRN